MTHLNIGQDNAWHEKYRVIAHSGGGINGKTYTDSLEAFENSYANGVRVFDSDISFTSDGILVLRHEWYDDLEQRNITENNIPNYENFIQTKIHYKYTPMSIYDLFEFMDRHQDVYVSIDSKDNVYNTFKELVQQAKNTNKEQILDRIIASFYNYEDYYTIKSIYEFSNYDIRQYTNFPHNYVELANFCVKNDIKVVRIYGEFIDAGDNIDILLDKNIKLYVCVVNNISNWQKYIDKGAYGIISDYLVEDDYNYIKE